MGNLESEDIVLRGIGESQDYWHRPSKVADPSPGVQPNNDSEIVKNPVRNGRAVIDAALRAQNVDLMIRDQSKPAEYLMDWVSREQYQPTHSAQIDIVPEIVTFLRALVPMMASLRDNQTIIWSSHVVSPVSTLCHIFRVVQRDHSLLKSWVVQYSRSQRATEKSRSIPRRNAPTESPFKPPI